MMQRYYWDPMRELAEAQRYFSTFFGGIPRQEPQAENGHSRWTPAVDISETADAYVFTVELPGMKPEAVEVEVKDNTLTLKGERMNAETNAGERYHHRERPTGRFVRIFRLPKPVDADHVSATYRDGILSVIVPLRAEAKPRKIQVQG
jgi:HSP20 family protein